MWFKHERTSARTTVRKDSIHPPYTPIWGSGCSYARTLIPGGVFGLGSWGCLCWLGGLGSWVLGAVPTCGLVRVQYVAGTLVPPERKKNLYPLQVNSTSSKVKSSTVKSITARDGATLLCRYLVSLSCTTICSRRNYILCPMEQSECRTSMSVRDCGAPHAVSALWPSLFESMKMPFKT